MADTPNGLASMTQARERRARRVMPPPRHPVAAGNADPIPTHQTDESVASETAPSDEPNEIVVEQPSASPRSTRSASKRSSSVRAPIAAAAAAGTAVGQGTASRPATLYLDESLLEFLEEARIAGLVSRPRLDISKSAVVRLALRRLEQEMTIDEIRDHLRAQPTDPTKTGRKRR